MRHRNSNGGGGLPTAYGSGSSSSFGYTEGGGGGYDEFNGGGGYGSQHRSSSYSSSSGGGMGVASGAAAPPSNVYSGKNDIRRRSSISSSRSNASELYPFIVSSIIAFVFFLSTIYYRNIYYTSMNDLHTARLNHEDIMSHTHDIHARNNGAQEEVRDLRERKTQLSHEIAVKGGQVTNLERQVSNLSTEKDQLQQKLNAALRNVDDVTEDLAGGFDPKVKKARDLALSDQIMEMKDHIARESYRSALERFGPGPHMVSIQVELPADPQNPNALEYPSFTVLLHPLEKMPHSVHLFLEQVHHGLWDGCSFVINAPHILQIGAHPGGAVPEDKMEPFVEHRLDVLSFQEYNDDYPHQKYTLGYAGRPGGPDFYINKMDNVQNHGPGGQKNWILKEEADPCFGKIVDGYPVVDKLFQLPSDAENDHLLSKPFHIIKARITTPLPKEEDGGKLIAKRRTKTPNTIEASTGTTTSSKGEEEEEEEEEEDDYKPQKFDHDYHNYRHEDNHNYHGNTHI